MLEIDSRAFYCKFFFVMYADRIGASGDVGKNGTFRSALAWLLLLIPFKVELVLQQEFVS
jgi:hypothetical protein